MGSGVALVLRNKWPVVAEVDSRTVKGELGKLGTLSIAQVETNKFVFNLYGQFVPGTDKRQLNYEAIYNALQLARSRTIETDVVAIPYKMGCDRAGGDWDIVFKMIEKVFSDRFVIICKYP